MRPHDDQVGTGGFDGFHHTVVYGVAFAHHGVDGDARLLHRGFDGVERGVRIGRGGRQVLRLAIGKIGAHAGKGIRIDHIDRGDLAAKGLGKTGGLVDCEHGGGRPIDRHQNMFEHSVTPFSCSMHNLL